MNEPDRHQPSKEDLDLASQLMNRVVSGTSSTASTGDDELFDILDAYKKSASLRTERAPSDSVRDAILENMDAEKQESQAKRFTLRTTFWKVAAVFLAAAGLALAYIILQPSEPALIAQSGSVQHVTELPDGSLVTLRPNSQLFEIESSDELQTYRIDGEAYFDIAENPSRLFTAQSGDAKVVVTGTEFSLANWGSTVRVYLESGNVRFSTLDESKSVSLEPGEVSESSDGIISDPVAVSGQVYTGWLENELRLNSRTVKDVAAEIEHHFNLTLEIPASIQDERLTGSLELQNADQVLSDLALSLNGRFEQIDDNRYRFEPEP